MASNDRTTPPPDAYFNRELSWLAFARRVLEQGRRPDLPLLERVKFVGIMGMLHDEFFMKRISGLKRQMVNKSTKRSLDGRTPREEFDACRAELLTQVDLLDDVVARSIRPELERAGIAILDHGLLSKKQKKYLRGYFRRSVEPILTPLAVDAEHPFPFISNLGLNLAVMLPEGGKRERFVRIKVPGNRPRWVPLEDGTGFVPLEQVIAANLDLMFPDAPPRAAYVFRVTRGAEADRTDQELRDEDDELRVPGSIVRLVSHELKARRFAGIVRLQTDEAMPESLVKWLTGQLGIKNRDVYRTRNLIALSHLLRFEPPEASRWRLPAHEPVTHPRLLALDDDEPRAIFDEIRRGDILLHHPYHSFDSSVLRFLQSAATDRGVLAIKLSIYRTSSDSPIVKALIEAARRGKQVAVLVEITARFDEAPNIAWGAQLEKEGVHVSYGVERLKTHVKLALVVREEQGEVKRYAHVGTGNYHTGTARIYEDLGLLTCEPEICEDVAGVFNELTGATAFSSYHRMIVAPRAMRKQFADLIRRETEHARAGRPCGIDAKMNQLQDPEIIRALYEASAAGVSIRLNIRGLCSLRPDLPGLSERIEVFGVIDRFLEHSRIFRFTNGGKPEHFIGSADWMKRNLDRRVETVVPILDRRIGRELDRILEVYHEDNCSVWDGLADGSYVRRNPGDGETRRTAQAAFIDLARRSDRSSRPGSATSPRPAVATAPDEARGRSTEPPRRAGGD